MMSDTETERILRYIVEKNGDCNEMELQTKTFTCTTCPLHNNKISRCKGRESNRTSLIVAKEMLEQIEKLNYLEKL